MLGSISSCCEQGLLLKFETQQVQILVFVVSHRIAVYYLIGETINLWLLVGEPDRGIALAFAFATPSRWPVRIRALLHMKPGMVTPERAERPLA
jgi:hypothetical protein